MGGKILASIFWVVNLSREFFGVFKTVGRFVTIPAYPGRVAPLEIFMAREFGMIFWGLNFGPGIFLGFVGSPRDLFSSFLPPFDHPCHFDSNPEYPPPPWGSNNTVNSHKILVKALVKSSRGVL